MSFDDAVKAGVAHAQKTPKNVSAAWIENQEVLIDDKGQITELSGPDEGNVYSRRLIRKSTSFTRFQGYHNRANGFQEGYVHLLLRAANFRMIPVRQAAEGSCTI